jgi:vacuolar-type H+-ATPase subunit D/Vma8
LKLYSSEDLFNLEKEIKNQSKETNSRRDDIKKEINEAEAYFGKEKYEKYQKAVKDIDPDIV